MTEQTPETPDSCLSHVSLGATDYPRALAFYEAVLPTLGIVKIMEHPGAAAFGRAFAEFWIQSPHDDWPAAPVWRTLLRLLSPRPRGQQDRSDLLGHGRCPRIGNGVGRSRQYSHSNRTPTRLRSVPTSPSILILSVTSISTFTRLEPEAP